ncbi:MAG: hypothetical protein AUI15_05660 [Actinobacteria bacterium 13_2_20CM_2_66_6]|nr:MAG: hypothetical protein AUI15_05660 [Actinobacteria bacterium 13_2_20CM_2_66_6]TME92305.1 MAG: hypothetical protein E6I34_08995 [Chloroflexota bacterium]
MRRGFGLIWLVVTVIIVATVGVIAYQAGWSEGFGQHLPAADGTTGVAPYPYYYGYGPHFFGFGWIFGLLFFLFILWLLFRVARFGMWGGRGGYGGWKHHSSGGVPPAIDERMREWHQRAHGEQPSQSPGTPPPPPPTSSV